MARLIDILTGLFMVCVITYCLVFGVTLMLMGLPPSGEQEIAHVIAVIGGLVAVGLSGWSAYRVCREGIEHD
jgi:hypothetical protein